MMSDKSQLYLCNVCLAHIFVRDWGWEEGAGEGGRGRDGEQASERTASTLNSLWNPTLLITNEPGVNKGLNLISELVPLLAIVDKLESEEPFHWLHLEKIDNEEFVWR